MAWTSDDLLAAVRREMFAPDASDQSDADLLAFADEEMESIISASVKNGREGHWLTHEDIEIVPGTTTYDVPRRALAKGLRGVQVVTAEGQTYNLTPTDPLDLRTRYESNPGAGLPTWYAFEANTLRLGTVPAVAGYTLRLFYLRTPGKLILTSAGVSVVSVTTSSELAVDGTPDATTLAVGALFDVVSGDEPYPVLFADLEVSGAALDTIEVASPTFTVGPPSIPAEAVQNRQPAYVVPAETTVYPPIPRSMWPALVRGTAAACLEAVRDPGAESMRMRADRALRSAVDVMEPRDDRRSVSIVGSSTLRAGRRGWVGWWR